ncbi:hypothetical protein N9Z27_02005 [Alphaproteobacteria bacterium]|nr:hypothetical protein [Alphaproteobacteria bacterium]
MSAKIITFDGANDENRCKCKSAVLKAYKCMSSDEPHIVALEAAKRVYQYHHPEDSKENQALTVERWVMAENFH